ncbi:MAG: lipopolysaccharide biosynthesis protein [Bacteroidota bacterium]
MNNLKDKAVSGVFWSLLERSGNQLIQFVIGLILARLLMPKDYGLIGMILIFISFAQVIVDGGFASALIRKKNPSFADYSTVFWFNILVAILCYIALFFSAPSIAKFFNEPKLISITRIVALTIVINSLGIIQKTILTKDLDFKSQAKINLTSILLSGVIGIYCAYNSNGVWALVIQNLCKNIFLSIGFWTHSKWQPQILFSKISFKELFGFGSNLTLALLLNAISENLYGIIIGKYFNAISLGYYHRANQFQKLPVISIYGAIGAVSYPLLAEMQTNSQNVKDGYRLLIKLTAFVLFPIMAILAATASPMIIVLLTEKWQPVIPLLQLLCIAGALYPLHAINIDVLKVKGRTDLIFKLQIIKQILEILMIFFCFRWGIYGLVIGEIVLNIIALYINAYYSSILINYNFIDQIKDVMNFAIISVLIALFIIGLSYIITNLYVKFLLIPVLGGIIYIIISKLLKVKEYYILSEIFSKLLFKFGASKVMKNN